MKIALTEFGLALLFIFTFGVPVQAKQCPSRMAEKMHQVGEHELYWGLEFRLTHFFMWDKDLSADQPAYEFNHGGFFALRGATEWAPVPWVNFRLETELKARNGVDNCNAWAVDLKKEFQLIPQLRHMYVQLEPADDTQVRVGRQNIVWGSQALLDNFFDAISLDQKLGEKFQLEAFAGVFVPELTRETLGCGYELYYENRRAWKRLCTMNYADVWMGGAFLTLKHFKPHRIRFAGLYQRDRRDDQEISPQHPEPLTMVFGSFSVSGPIGETLSYDAEALIGYKPENQAWIPGYVTSLEATFDMPRGHLFLIPRAIGSFPDTQGNHFTAVGEHFDLGARARYGLYDGHVKSLLVRYRWWAYQMEMGYHLHSADFVYDFIDDELEAGITFFWKNDPRYQFIATYSLINTFIGDLAPNHGFRIQARILF